MLYRCVGGCTTGRSSPAAGLGAKRAALALRFWLRRFLRAAWSNQVLIITRFMRPCIMPLTLRKCTFGMTWFPAPVIFRSGGRAAEQQTEGKDAAGPEPRKPRAQMA